MGQNGAQDSHEWLARWNGCRLFSRPDHALDKMLEDLRVVPVLIMSFTGKHVAREPDVMMAVRTSTEFKSGAAPLPEPETGCVELETDRIAIVVIVAPLNPMVAEQLIG